MKDREIGETKPNSLSVNGTAAGGKTVLVVAVGSPNRLSQSAKEQFQSNSLSMISLVLLFIFGPFNLQFGNNL